MQDLSLLRRFRWLHITLDRLQDRWIWSALGIHRVPYEFWKVGTWKPAVNARSTDSHFFFCLDCVQNFFRVLLYHTPSNPCWNSLQPSEITIQWCRRIHFVTFEDMLVLISTMLPRNILHTSNRFLNIYILLYCHYFSW